MLVINKMFVVCGWPMLLMLEPTFSLLISWGLCEMGGEMVVCCSRLSSSSSSHNKYKWESKAFLRASCYGDVVVLKRGNWACSGAV